MSWKKLLLITAGLSVIGIVPKLIKTPLNDRTILLGYFIYISICFLSFYAINKRLWALNAHPSYPILFGLGLISGAILLAAAHLLLSKARPDWLLYFLNLKDGRVASILKVTAFRAFIVQSIAFACLYFLKNKDEKSLFEQQIDHLNQRLNHLPYHPAPQNEYKTVVIARFQDKVIPINVSEIAFFYLKNGIVIQHLFSNEKYVQNDTLESFERELDPNIFYRANRQFLIHRKAVEKVEQIDNRKLKVILTQPIPEDIVISKAKSSAFIRWLQV